MFIIPSLRHSERSIKCGRIVSEIKAALYSVCAAVHPQIREHYEKFKIVTQKENIDDGKASRIRRSTFTAFIPFIGPAYSVVNVII